MCCQYRAGNCDVNTFKIKNEKTALCAVCALHVAKYNGGLWNTKQKHNNTDND